MAEPAIALAGVSVRYGPHLALGEASLAIGEGEFIALVGGSGSGKTTLLKTINGLVRPDAGTVQVAGAAEGEPAHLLRRRIGYVFQEIGLFPHLTVAENIGVTPRLLGWDAARIEARVRELLDLVDLPQQMAARRPAELSGGQRQRVGVARA
ncbi:MAG TPA: ATP-binding cassette domain-containing protein, partial [Phenylobacterium sp.]|nr:ATP-binding cassette domain-containing protein [Phenylobacterium sp.]